MNSVITLLVGIMITGEVAQYLEWIQVVLPPVYFYIHTGTMDDKVIVFMSIPFLSLNNYAFIFKGFL